MKVCQAYIGITLFTDNQLFYVNSLLFTDAYRINFYLLRHYALELDIKKDKRHVPRW